MRRRLPIIITCLLTFLLGCRDPEYVRDHPQIVSAKIASVTPLGVDVLATLDAASMDKISDVGVVWGETVDLSINKDFVLHLGKPTSESFTAEIRSNLVSGEDYIIRVFVSGNGKTVYSLPLKIESQGSEGPLIESVSPLDVIPGDLVTIAGKRFGTDKEDITVGFETKYFTYPATIKTIADTKIEVTVPVFYVDSARLVITKKENKPVTSSATIIRRLPKVTSIRTYGLCSPIVIKGEHLLTLGKPVGMNVNDRYMDPMPTITDSLITISSDYHRPNIKIQLIFPGYSYVLTKTLPDPSTYPVVTTTDLPDVVPEDHLLVLEGTNFPTCGGLDVMVAEVAGSSQLSLQIVDVTSTKVTVNVNGGGCYDFKLSLTHQSGEIYTSDFISPRQYTVTSITPDHGTFGTEITIEGTDLSGMQAFIGRDPQYDMTGGLLLQPISESDTEVTGYIPSPFDLNYIVFDDDDGSSLFTVEKCNVLTDLPFTLEINKVTLGDFSPKNSVAGGLTITGTNFLEGNVGVWIENLIFNYRLDMGSITDTEIVTMPPSFNVQPGTYKVVIYQYGLKYEFTDPLVIP